MNDNRQTPLPRGRVNRMLRLGRLAGGVAGSALAQSATQLARGRVPAAAEVLLNPANARRVAEEMSKMRGAVMKIGQLLSMEAGDLLPPELTEIFADLRAGAHAMPPAQLQQTLDRAWGHGWQQDFDCFDLQPFAAASIGQVHAAVDRDGHRLAVKVQYPGVADSIDSDVDNVGKLLRLLRLLPPGVELEPLLEIARRQLHEEADYRLEARNLEAYRGRIGEHAAFRLPRVFAARSDSGVLAMSYVDGAPIESLARAPAPLRDRVAARMIELTLREFLQWGLVQSDPNFANFVYDEDREVIGLFDFGALRYFESKRMDTFAGLLEAALCDDLAAIVDAAIGVGYLASEDPFNFRLALGDLVRIAAEPARNRGIYDFAGSSVSRRLGERLYELRQHEQFQRLPPEDVIFLQRKLAGIYLLCVRLGARVDVRELVAGVLAERGSITAARRAAV